MTRPEHKLLESNEPIEVICQYCGEPAQLKPDDYVYKGRSYGGKVYVCQCVEGWAWVGVHRNSPDNKPLGTLANKELRQWRMNAHEKFDPMWRGVKQRKARKKAYQWLSRKMGIPFDECHIAMFDINQCRRVVEICENHWKDKQI